MDRLLWAAGSFTGLECCFAIPFAIIWVLLMRAYLSFQWSAAPAALDEWAKRSGYQIIRQKKRTFRKGPFFWASNNQVVYRIEVSGRDGPIKRGWVRIGGFWWPDVSQVAVRWDEPRPVAFGKGPGESPMYDRDVDG